MGTNWRTGILAAVMVGSVACAADGPTTVQGSSLILNFMTPGTVARVTVEVSGPGLLPALIVNIAVGADSTARDTLTIPAGSARRIVVTAVDTAGITTHRADTTVALVAGGVRTLAMRLDPLQAGLGITVTFGGVRLTVADTSTRSLPVGDTVRVNAVAFSPSGARVPAESLQWGSSNPAVFSVEGGLVRAVRRGVAQLSVSFQGVAMRVPVRVFEGPPFPGLAAFYPFDGDALDHSGNDRHLTNVEGTFVLDRNGASSAIRFATMSAMATRSWSDFPTDSLSVSLWYRIDGQAFATGYSFFEWGNGVLLAPNFGGVNLGIDENWVARGCGSAGNGYAVVGVVGGPYQFLFDAAGCLSYSTVSSWAHVVITASGGVAKYYVNGVLAGTKAFDTPMLVSTRVLYIGNRDNPSAQLTAREIDDVSVWDRALSAAEVAALYAYRR